MDKPGQRISYFRADPIATDFLIFSPDWWSTLGCRTSGFEHVSGCSPTAQRGKPVCGVARDEWPGRWEITCVG